MVSVLPWEGVRRLESWFVDVTDHCIANAGQFMKSCKHQVKKFLVCQQWKTEDFLLYQKHVAIKSVH